MSAILLDGRLAMMASTVTPPEEDEGAKVDGVVEAGGVVVSV